MGSPKSNWFCAQIGAREHYAIPRALHRSGRLARLFTDFWAAPALRGLLASTPTRAARSLAARHHTGLDHAAVTSWNLPALRWEIRLRRAAAGSAAGLYHGFSEIGQRFAQKVSAGLQRRISDPANSIFFAYDTGALEAFQWCRTNGVATVLDQMDPGRFEVELVSAEEKLWPGWALRPASVPTEYFARRETEWALADRIIVNSRWSLDALVKQGVPLNKLVVVPLCFESTGPDVRPMPKIREAGKPLRVLFLGQVILRKGIQYLIQAARLLADEPIRIDVVGPAGISDDVIRATPKNIFFHGRATRDQAEEWYRQADLFVLPTLSDGFALTQLEAMSHGLPVVTTPCCGEVVTDGEDGFIAPVRDAAALAGIFQTYLARADLLAAQSQAAKIKAGQFTLARLAENLAAIEAGLIK